MDGNAKEKDWWKDELKSVIREVDKILGKPNEYPKEIELDSGLAFGYFAPNIYTFIAAMKKEDRQRLSLAVMYHIDEIHKDMRAKKQYQDNMRIFDKSPSELSELELALFMTFMVMYGRKTKK